MVEPVACPVLTRSCFRVYAQQLVAVDLDSRMRRGLWISGANVNEEQYPQVLTRKFLDEEERRNICRHKNPFTSLISVHCEDGVCCVFTLSLNLALFNLIVAINKRAVNDFSSTATTESLHYLCIWNVITLVWCTGDFETEQVLLQYRGEVCFCSCCGHSGGIYLWMNVSGDVTKLCLTVRCASLLHFLQSSRVFKHLRGVNTFVFFLACSLKANPSCVPLGEMLDIDVLDPVKLSQSEDNSDYGEVVSRSHEADDVWGWSEQCLQRARFSLIP